MLRRVCQFDCCRKQARVNRAALVRAACVGLEVILTDAESSRSPLPARRFPLGPYFLPPTSKARANLSLVNIREPEKKTS